MTLPSEQPLSQFIEDLLLEAAPTQSARPVRESRPSPAPGPVAQTPRRFEEWDDKQMDDYLAEVVQLRRPTPPEWPKVCRRCRRPADQVPCSRCAEREDS